MVKDLPLLIKAPIAEGSSESDAWDEALGVGLQWWDRSRLGATRSYISAIGRHAFTEAWEGLGVPWKRCDIETLESSAVFPFPSPRAGGGFCNLGGSGWTALQLDAGHGTNGSTITAASPLCSQGAATHRTGMWMIWMI